MTVWEITSIIFFPTVRTLMAEAKRIQLEAPKSFTKDKKIKEVPPTYRFELKLNTDDSNAESVEFSYTELLKNARAASREMKQLTNEDPFSLDDDSDKLQEIARHFEEKYNPKPGRKKKKKLAISEDYIDKGMGYDETDPFIDNEEAYDELVPSTLTTQYGGFYINKGELEFRNLSESENGNETKVRRKRLKQMTDKESKRRRRIGNEENQKRRGRKPLHETMSALTKVKKKTQPTVADMLEQHKAQLEIQRQENLRFLQIDPIPVEREVEAEVVENAPQIQIIPGQASTISEAIESVVKAAGEDASNGSAGPITGSSDGEEMKIPIENIEAPKLPNNLPPDLDDVLAKLKEAAYKSEEGKCKFFSEEVNRMLLSVELKAQELSSAQRSTIYSHLASHLPCTKETLQKRAKKLRLDQEDGKLREPMQRLKDGIAEVMPEMMEKYVALVKACDLQDDEKKNENVPNTTSDGEDSQEESDKKTSRMPKKHFEWNDTIRKYLCDVVRIKLKCYEVSKTRIQSAEEYLKHFLEAEVKHLWPPGWMQSRILFRESRDAHFYITNRPKKQILVPKKTATPVSSVMLTMKPAVSLLNSAVISQETEFDTFIPDKSVPSIAMPQFVDDALERRENLDTVDERAHEFAKLFSLPIKCTVPGDMLSNKQRDKLIQAANKMTADLPTRTSSPLINTASDTLVPSKHFSTKSEKHSKSIQMHVQNKQVPYTSTKVADFNSFTEGSLASDMLARIICASLADFPYAGSQNADTSKTTSVISTNPSLIKDTRSVNSKFSNDILTSPKKLETGKSLNTEMRNPSQEAALHGFPGVGINIESLLNMHQNVTRHSDVNTLIKNKGLPSEVTSSAVNLKLKDAIIPHSRQFVETFERTSDVPSVSKKHVKGHNSNLQGLIVTSANTSRLVNTNELMNEYPSSPSPRSAMENAQKIAFDLASKYNSSITSQGPNTTTPYKKRSKYTSNKNVDQWNHFVDASLGASLLEGMKGFPFPVASLPTPPPAHSSSPHRTSHSQHNSPRTSSHISPNIRNLHDSKSDPSNPSSQTHSHISVTEVPRRQSLIQGPWKSSSTCQAPSTSLSHFMVSTSPPISNPNKTTSPSNHSSNSYMSMSPAPAHSLSQIEKVTTAFNRSHSPIPLRLSPSHVSALTHTPKTSPSNAYTQQLGQSSYTTHQSSHSVSPNLHQQTILRSNNAFDPSNPTSTPTCSTGTFTPNSRVENNTSKN